MLSLNGRQSSSSIIVVGKGRSQHQPRLDRQFQQLLLIASHHTDPPESIEAIITDVCLYVHDVEVDHPIEWMTCGGE